MRSLAFVVAALVSGCSHPNTCGDLGAGGCYDDKRAYVCLNGMAYEQDCLKGTTCVGRQLPARRLRGHGLYLQRTNRRQLRRQRRAQEHDRLRGQRRRLRHRRAQRGVPHTRLPRRNKSIARPTAAKCESAISTAAATASCKPATNPEQVGNACVGGACIDRCTLLEARDYARRWVAASPRRPSRK